MVRPSSPEVIFKTESGRFCPDPLVLITGQKISCIWADGAKMHQNGGSL